MYDLASRQTERTNLGEDVDLVDTASRSNIGDLYVSDAVALP